jgi:integrase
MLATGRRTGLLFPRTDGQPWRKHDWRNWQRRVHRPAAERVGLDAARPTTLRGSFVSLLVWEGEPIAIVAKNAGHSIATAERHYLKIFRGLRPGQSDVCGGGDPCGPRAGRQRCSSAL